MDLNAEIQRAHVLGRSVSMILNAVFGVTAAIVFGFAALFLMLIADQDRPGVRSVWARAKKNWWQAIPAMWLFAVGNMIVWEALEWLLVLPGMTPRFDRADQFFLLATWFGYTLPYIVPSSIKCTLIGQARLYVNHLREGRWARVLILTWIVSIPSLLVLGFISGLYLSANLSDTFFPRLLDKTLLDFSIAFMLVGAVVLFRRLEALRNIGREIDVSEFLQERKRMDEERITGPEFWL